MHDILLKGGKIIDPLQGISEVGSVAIKDGKIAAVGKKISKEEAKKVFNMEGKIITPGLIDIHCHPVAGFADFGLQADEIGLNTGVTLLCDAGSAGAANFEAIRRFIIQPAKTEILCFLNLSTTGLIKIPEIRSKHDIDIEYIKRVVDTNRDTIKGIKIRAVQSLAEGLGIEGIEIAKKLTSDLRIPLMVHLGEIRDRVPNDPLDNFSRATVSLLEKGDILSHYLTWEPGGMILKDGTVYPELEAAQQRGVVLDSCNGMYHFSFAVARHAIEKGLIPTVISTDLSSIGLPVVQSLAVVMSKFLNLGLNLDQVIEMTTLNPAKVLGEEMARGSLMFGMNADITIMELVERDYLFGDGYGRGTLHGKVLLEPRMVFKGGKMMPAYSNYHIPPLFE
jgi:dihydroorotase